MKVDDRTKEVILTEAEYVELVNRHLSEEPVSKKRELLHKQDDKFKEVLADLRNKKHYKTLEVNLRNWWQNTRRIIYMEEPVSEELHIVIDNEVKKIWDEINTGHDYCIIDSYNQFYGICIQIAECAKKEPVSEELLDTTQTITYNGEVYIRRYKDELDAFACKYPMSVPKTSKKYAKYSDVDLTIAVKAGAQWQKEVFEKNRLAACDRATKEEIEREQDFVDKVLIGEQRQPTFSDAIEYGIKWQKQKIKRLVDKIDVNNHSVEDLEDLYDALCEITKID